MNALKFELHAAWLIYLRFWIYTVPAPKLLILRTLLHREKKSNPRNSVPDLDPWIRKFYGPSGSFHHQAKIVTKTFISTVFVTYLLVYDFLSLKNEVNVPSKSKKKIWQKIFFCLRLEGRWRKEQDPEPDPLVRGTNPRIRIHTNVSRIRNTALVIRDILLATGCRGTTVQAQVQLLLCHRLWSRGKG